MEETPLISVIVPIYNVAPYIRKCLDSLKAQTMKEIEVICIDDGSVDNSGKIAEEYAADPRFRIIHTENRGLSATRNRGIDEAKSDWLMFVDSDDWVEDEFCQIPYEAAVENRADLVIFQADWWKNGKRQKSKNINTPVGFVDEFTAHEFGRVNTWNKLYKKELFKTIRFPEGHNYEDRDTTHRLVHEATRILMIRDKLYHYISRERSITHTNTASNKRDGFIFMLERRDFLDQCGFPIEKLYSELVGAAISYLSVTSPCEDKVYKEAKKIADNCKSIPQTLAWKQKVGLIAWRIYPSLFYRILKVTKKR